MRDAGIFLLAALAGGFIFVLVYSGVEGKEVNENLRSFLISETALMLYAFLFVVCLAPSVIFGLRNSVGAVLSIIGFFVFGWLVLACGFLVSKKYIYGAYLKETEGDKKDSLQDRIDDIVDKNKK